MIPIAADHRHPPAPWPCRRCALVLGSIHLIGAFSLLLVDISTNDRSETAFAIATALIAFICSLFAFVAARRRRRFDRTVLRLLAGFATVAIGVCVALFIENVVRINSDQRWRDRSLSIVHAALISAALIEGTISLITLFVCYVSLHHRAYAVVGYHSPFATLMIGEYSKNNTRPTSLVDDDNMLHLHHQYI